jgi:hypothetical protein
MRAAAVVDGAAMQGSTTVGTDGRLAPAAARAVDLTKTYGRATRSSVRSLASTSSSSAVASLP